MPLVVHSSRIGRSIIVAIVVRPAVVMLCYSVGHSHRRRPTDSPNPVRPNFVCCCNLAGLVAVAATGQLHPIGSAATGAGIGTMIQQLAFPRNTQIHCLCMYPIGVQNAYTDWCAYVWLSVCVWLWMMILVNGKKE